MLCVILWFFYPLHLYVFVLICQYYVVLLERTNKDIIYSDEDVLYDSSVLNDVNFVMTKIESIV